MRFGKKERMTDPANYDDPLPASIDGERTILGAILLDNEAFAQAAEHLRPADFSLDSHRRIFLRMADLMSGFRAVDIVTLANELTKNKEIEAVGGVAYLACLTEGLPRRPVISDYIKIVKDKSLLRKAMEICNKGFLRAADQFEPGETVITSVIRDLEDAVDSNLQGNDLESIGQWLDQNDVFAPRVPGIKTGIDDYDELTYGLHKGELTVAAGRTSSGKTSHCGTITWEMARRGHCVGCFINEQAKASFIGRMLCGRSGVSFNAYRRGTLDWVEKQYIENTVTEFKQLPIFWDQRSSMSVASIRARAARLKRSGELDVILVDQLSRVSGEGVYQKGMRSDEVIGEKVAALKGVAIDLDVPLVLYHQLNRETTKQDEGRPTLANLKGSGAIEEHADNVILFHRPEYYKRDDPLLKGKAEIIVAKQRDGETRTVHCEFVAETCLWRNRK